MGELEKALARGEQGLVDPFKDAKAKPLLEHVNDWIADLRQLRRDGQYIAPCESRLTRLAKECEWAKLGDISADSFCHWRETAMSDVAKNALDPKRHRQQPMGARTKNHYFETLRSFCRWAVKRGRMAGNPVKSVEKVDGTGDVRRARRALCEAELAALLGVIAERHQLAYRIILATGLAPG